MASFNANGWPSSDSEPAPPFVASTSIDRKDFGIVWNKALDNGGALLGDEVWVSINLETTKKKEG